jgi:hypothetical protein
MPKRSYSSDRALSRGRTSSAYCAGLIRFITQLLMERRFTGKPLARWRACTSFEASPMVRAIWAKKRPDQAGSSTMSRKTSGPLTLAATLRIPW